MKIDSQRIDGGRTALDAAVTDRAAAPSAHGESPAAAGATDHVELSPEARRLAALRSELGDLTAVDDARMARLRQAVEAGSYAPDPKQLAESLLRRLAEDEGIG